MKRLQDRLAVLAGAILEGEATYRQGREIAAEISRLRWLLSAYPASVQDTSGR